MEKIQWNTWCTRFEDNTYISGLSFYKLFTTTDGLESLHTRPFQVRNSNIHSLHFFPWGSIVDFEKNAKIKDTRHDFHGFTWWKNNLGKRWDTLHQKINWNKPKYLAGCPVTSRFMSALNFKMFIFNEQWLKSSVTSKLRLAPLKDYINTARRWSV